MTELLPQYSAEMAECDWDAAILFEDQRPLTVWDAFVWALAILGWYGICAGVGALIWLLS